jgi:leucyl/phenylalanyl-tRNA--protein transferase
MNDPSFPWLGADDDFLFPEPDDNGLVATGGNLSPGLLLSAYRQGVFPWFNSDRHPIVWWSLDPRFVLLPGNFHVPRSLKKALRSKPFRISVDQDFESVIRSCAIIKRKGQRGTWITKDMIDAYIGLHKMGYAHSAEAWDGDNLAGGLYGLALGGCFFGESMFSRLTGASSQAFAVFAEKLFASGFTLIDCQQETPHLARFGAAGIPRGEFLKRLECGLATDTELFS